MKMKMNMKTKIIPMNHQYCATKFLQELIYCESMKNFYIIK